MAGVLSVALVMALDMVRVLVIALEWAKVLGLVVAIFITLAVAMAKVGLMDLVVAQGVVNEITRTPKDNFKAYS
jgi:hypothetical protein